MKDLAKQWPAYDKWNWDYFKQIVGDKQVGIYNNIKSDAYTPINKADDYVTFGEYVDMVKRRSRPNGGSFFSISSAMPRSLQRILPGPIT